MPHRWWIKIYESSRKELVFEKISTDIPTDGDRESGKETMKKEAQEAYDIYVEQKPYISYYGEVIVYYYRNNRGGSAVALHRNFSIARSEES
jgi:hypothetical protein